MVYKNYVNHKTMTVVPVPWLMKFSLIIPSYIWIEDYCSNWDYIKKQPSVINKGGKVLSDDKKMYIIFSSQISNALIKSILPRLRKIEFFLPFQYLESQ